MENPLTGLLSSKVCIPFLHRRCIQRERLDDLLIRSSQVPWTIVCAGAGYGKTTLVAEWLQRTRQKAAWLSLDELDNDPYQFLRYMAAAVHRVLPHVGQQLIPLFTKVTEMNPQTLWIELINAWIDCHESITFVLDDYHVINNVKIHEMFTSVAINMAPGLRFVLLSRTESPFPLAKLRSQGQLVEIRTNDLQCTVNEAEQFITLSLGITVEKDKLTEIFASTEGWIAGLQMGALSRLRSSSTTIPRGNLSSVFAFFYEEVWAKLEQDQRDFLLYTAILRELSACVINRLLARNDSQQMLEAFEAHNLFVVPIDADRHIYRYHHLFGEMLRDQLRKHLNFEHVCQLHLRASQIFAENGSFEEAIDHAILSEEWPYAINLILQQADTWMLRGEEERLLKQIKRIPLLQQSHSAELCLKQLWALANSLRMEELHWLLEVATPILSTHEDPTIRAEFAVFSGIRFLDEGRIFLAEERFMCASKGLGEKQNFLQSVLLMQKSNVHLVHDEIDESRKSVGLMTRINRTHADPWMPYVSYWWSAQLELMLGNLGKGLQILHELAEGMRIFTQGSLPNNSAVCFLNLATGYLERGDFETAAEWVEQALEILDPEIDPMNTGLLLLLQARLEALRQPQEQIWVKILDRAWHLPRIHNYPRIVHRLNAMRVKLSLYAHSSIDPALAVERWFAFAGIQEQSHAIFFDIPDPICRKNFASLILARAWVQLKNMERAKCIAQTCVQNANQAGRNLCATEGYLLLADIARRCGDMDVYHQQITAALQLAYAERIVAPFLEYSQKVIQDAASIANHLGYVDLATCLAKDEAESVQMQSALSADALSQRECEVLNFVAQGLSNAEIGRTLFIAPSTVKKHLEHIYSKLGVRRRTQALVRARELGLFTRSLK